MRVVFLVQDSLPHARVGPELTPTLWSLITNGGGWAPTGGRSVLASSTYPNHASFVSGADVVDHRIFANTIWSDSERRFVCSSKIGPAVETIFDVALRGGVSSSAVLGDQTMVGVMAATRADVHWPPMGRPPPGICTDALGYAANSAVISAIDELDSLATDLAVIHLNEPDSTQHIFGPDAPETIEEIRRCDDDLAAIVERLRSRWSDTVLFVVSDHEQETVDAAHEPIDLAALLHGAGMSGDAHNEGMIGLVIGGPGAAVVRTLDPIEDAVDLDDGVTLVWSGPGRLFGTGVKSKRGQHGSPRTMTQVATVSGGHAVVPALADSLADRSPHATDWAPTIACLLDLSLPSATGVSVLRS